MLVIYEGAINDNGGLLEKVLTLGVSLSLQTVPQILTGVHWQRWIRSGIGKRDSIPNTL